MLFECPNCDGKISRHYVELRVCQDCQKVVNIGELLSFLRNLGVTEHNVKRIRDNLTFPRLYVI